MSNLYFFRDYLLLWSPNEITTFAINRPMQKTSECILRMSQSLRHSSTSNCESIILLTRLVQSLNIAHPWQLPRCTERARFLNIARVIFIHKRKRDAIVACVIVPTIILPFLRLFYRRNAVVTACIRHRYLRPKKRNSDAYRWELGTCLSKFQKWFFQSK